MHRRVINAVSAIQLERNFYVLRNAVINAEIKIADIAAPISGAGYDSVRPALILCSSAVVFLIIQKIMRKLPHNFVFMAEHQ